MEARGSAENLQESGPNLVRGLRIALEKGLIRSRPRAIAHAHATRQRGETGSPFFHETHARSMGDSEPLLETAQKAPTVPQRLRNGCLEVPAAFQSRDGNLSLRRADAHVATVQHLQPLRGELDVDETSPTDLQVAARRRPVEPFVPELAFHPPSQVLNTLRRRRTTLVGRVLRNRDHALANALGARTGARLDERL